MAARVAFVTGAASGIGRATALAFAAEGATVLATDRDVAKLSSLAADGIATAQGVAEHLGLDRRAVREAKVVDGVHQRGRQGEVVEAGLAFLGFDDEVFEFPGGTGGLGARSRRG